MYTWANRLNSNIINLVPVSALTDLLDASLDVSYVQADVVTDLGLFQKFEASVNEAPDAAMQLPAWFMAVDAHREGVNSVLDVVGQLLDLLDPELDLDVRWFVDGCLGDLQEGCLDALQFFRQELDVAPDARMLLVLVVSSISRSPTLPENGTFVRTR